MFVRSLGKALLAGASAIAVCGAADAQNVPQPSGTTTAGSGGATENQLEEVTVTARRRSESIEQVPMSVTAMNSADLEAKGIVTEADLQEAVPGLIIRETVGNNNFTPVIRGQTVDPYSSSPPAVLIYYDEVNVAPHALSSVFDIDNIQVLKGPQGTLFGRNTTGGALLYQTAQPTDQFEGYVVAKEGSYDTTAFQGAINIPIDPKVALRIAANYEEGGAYAHNIPTDDEWGATNDRAVRATVLLKPIDDLQSTTTFQYDRRWGVSVPNILTSVYPCGTPGLTTVLDCATLGGAVQTLKAIQAAGPYTSDLDVREAYTADSLLALNNTQYNINDQMMIKNILSIGRTFSNGPYDYDATPYSILGNTLAGETMISDQYSEELQLQGNALGGALKYTVGFYYSYENDITDAPLDYFGAFVAFDAETTERTTAGYIQATYQLDDQWSVTGGFRYTGDSVKLSQLGGSLYSIEKIGDLDESTSVDKPSYTFSLDYQVTPDVLLYVTTRGSYRSGGFNFDDAPIPTLGAVGGNEFLPETARDVEAGVKTFGRIEDIPYRFNASFYNSWIDNAQRVAYVLEDDAPVGVTANATSAEVSGVDADFEVKPVRWLGLGGQLNYSDARFTDPEVLLLGQPRVFGPFGDSPRWSGSLYGQVSDDLPNSAGTLTFRTDVYGQSGSYISNFNNTTNPDSRLSGYGLVNMRLGWLQIFGTNLSASLDVHNLLNHYYFTGGLPEGSDLGANNEVPGRPRWITGELRYEF